MTELRASFAAAREHLMEGLYQFGFRLVTEDVLVGDVDIAGVPIEHEIVVSPDFPIEKPKVRTPGGEGGLSWHRDVSGAFCLWSDDEASHLPWAEAEAVIRRIQEWHEKDAVGWPDDPPDLDLERYWPPSDGLLVHGDLEPLVGRPCRVIRRPNGLLELIRGDVPKKKTRRVLGATVVDVGELDRPIHTFDELADRLEAQESGRLRVAIESGRTAVLMVRYRRQEHVGSLGLLARGRNPHRLMAIQTAPADDATRLLRAGFDADVLARTAVAVVGVGAVGSLVADLLVRSGVGRLTLVDGGIVRPGNCIRHLVGYNDVGRPKAVAVRDLLVASHLASADRLRVVASRLSSVEMTETLFAQHDIVMDATGNGPATALILAASRVMALPAVTVCLQRGGTVVRVDRAPLEPGEEYPPAVPRGGPSVDLREGGCGEPVSPTPPWACAAAAARAVAMAVDILSTRRQYPPSVVDVLVAEVGVLDSIGIGA